MIISSCVWRGFTSRRLRGLIHLIHPNKAQKINVASGFIMLMVDFNAHYTKMITVHIAYLNQLRIWALAYGKPDTVSGG